MKLKLERAKDATPLVITERDETIMKLSYELGLLSVQALAMELNSPSLPALQKRITTLTKQKTASKNPPMANVDRPWNNWGKKKRAKQPAFGIDGLSPLDLSKPENFQTL